VHTVVTEARKGSDGRARKMHAALSVLFSWLKQNRRVTANPCGGVWRPGPPDERERKLDDPEIIAFWRGCDAVGTPFGPLFQLMLLTGCRLREAANMTRAEVDDDGVWTIPGSRTKNHRSLALALPPLAQEIIEHVPVIESKAGFVFTTTGNAPVSGFSRAKKLLDAAMAKSAGRAVPAWRLHDLRRTAATGMAKLKVALPVIEKVLNHVSGSFGGIVGVYQQHDYATEKAEALQRWSLQVAGLVAPTDNVVVMNKAPR
jgi:integrase